MIQMTSDPIISLDDAQRVLSTNDETALTMAINAVSRKFLRHTGRRVIGYDADTAIVEDVRPEEPHRIWLAASPVVTDGKEFQAEAVADGEAQQTYLYSEDEIEVVSCDQYAYITPIGWAFRVSRDPSWYVRLTYYGGWSTVPGDVIAGAVAQLHVEIERLGGMVGMSSVSRDRENVQYDRSAVISEAAEAWTPYVV